MKSSGIALVSSSYYPYVGGVEEHVAQVARQLIERGHPVEVWTVDRGECLGTRVVEGVRVRYLPAPLPARSLGAVLRFLVRFPSAIHAWTGAYRELKPNVLHVHCFGPNGLYALAMHRRFGAPMIVTSHGETLADDHGAFARSALLRGGLRRAVRSATQVTAPSEAVLSHLRTSFGLTGGCVIPNGVDMSVAAEQDAHPELRRGPYVLGVGRLGHMKGFDLLIEAFAHAEVSPEVRLIIVGDGPERSRLGAQVERLGLAGRVAFTGRQSAQGVARAMANAMVVAVPSRMEAFGIVALEAWRAGTALVMTNRGGAAEFVTHGRDGLLVDPQDTLAFAQTLANLVADPLRRTQMAAAGTQRVQEFTWERVVEEYETVYLLASRTRAT